MTKVLSTIGTVTGITGALLVALNMNMFVLGYTLFLTSSITWVSYAFMTKQTNLLILNLTFGIINLIGLYNFTI